MIHFLAGLPRTGSTLLGSLLGQNPNIHVTPTSPLYPLLVDTNESFNRLSLQYTFDFESVSDRVYKSLVHSVYADIKQPIIFDKHRGWPKNIPAIKSYINDSPVIIATVRPIAEIITSYIVLANKDPHNFIDTHLRRDGKYISNEARADLLWNFYMKSAYEHLQIGLKDFPENILLVEYDDIIYTPHAVLNRIYSTCKINHFKHHITNIKNFCKEDKDEGWGMKDLHTIRPALSKQSQDPEKFLPIEAINYFNQFNIKDQQCQEHS